MYHLILSGDDLETLLMALENIYDSFQEHFSMDVYKHMTSYIEVVGLIEHLKRMLEKEPNNVCEGELI